MPTDRNPATGLDAAWARTEKALPTGWHIYSLHWTAPRDFRIEPVGGGIAVGRPARPGAWSVICHNDAHLSETIAVHDVPGDLPDALAAITAKLEGTPDAD